MSFWFTLEYSESTLACTTCLEVGKCLALDVYGKYAYWLQSGELCMMIHVYKLEEINIIELLEAILCLWYL